MIEPGTPNPFSTSTRLSYTLPAAGPGRLLVYDVQGRQVARLADGLHRAGRHTLQWDGRDAQGRPLPAGTYFLRLEFAGRVEAQKIVLAH
jgi:flagellar hook assembly protein FlgD